MGLGLGCAGLQVLNESELCLCHSCLPRGWLPVLYSFSFPTRPIAFAMMRAEPDETFRRGFSFVRPVAISQSQPADRHGNLEIFDRQNVRGRSSALVVGMSVLFEARNQGKNATIPNSNPTRAMQSSNQTNGPHSARHSTARLRYYIKLLSSIQTSDCVFECSTLHKTV